MDARLLDKLDGLEGDAGMDGLFDFIGGLVQKAAPIVSSIVKGVGGTVAGATLGSTLVGAAASYANAQTQKKLIDAQAKLAMAQTEAQQIAANAAIQKAQIDRAAAQTVVNGISSGVIPPNATFAQAGQIAVREVVRTSGIDPNSYEGEQARTAIMQAVSPDRTLLYVAGGATLLLGVALLARRR